MKKPALKRDGWKVTHDGDNYFLTYSPGLIGELGACYKVNAELYDTVNSNDFSLEQILTDFNVKSTFEKAYNLKPPPSLPIRKNTLTKYYGGGFIVTDEGGKYFLDYQLARHGGGSRKFEISKEAYLDARSGNYKTSELFKKYNLYHLDVPENDVK